VLSVSLVVGALGCTTDPASWLILFSGGVPPGTVSVHAEIRTGSCEGAAIFSDDIAMGERTGMTPSDLADGTYYFYAEARSASCSALAAGCTVVTAPITTESITVTLSPVSMPPRCEASMCNTGVCGRRDAGIDGGASDLGIDGGASDLGIDGGASDLGIDGGAPDLGIDGGAPDLGIDGGASDLGIDGGASDLGIDGGGIGDGGVSDGGAIAVDASGATTCAINVTPTSGTTAAAFDFSGASNGTMCTVRLDGAAPLVAPCITMLTFAGSTFSVGAHTVELFVGAGPSGPTSCGAMFTVTP